MPSNKFKLILLLSAAMTVSACASSRPALDAGSDSFGVATAQNIAAQRVAPTPEQKANTYIPANRARQKRAREIYEAGETPDPTVNGTTED